MTTQRERAAWIALAVLAVILRIVAHLHYRVDSDEPQHLHVTWGWTAGYLQYRDIFDNHAPLFHMATAPILALAGEGADVLLWMRVPMWLLWGVVLAGTYILGAQLYSRRVGAWSALFLSLLPTFFLKSVEYRADNLWSAIWWVAVMVLSGGPLTAGRFFIGGFLLGAALMTSFKTTLILASVVGAGMAVLVRFRRPIPWLGLVAASAGFAIVPVAIFAYFASRGALAELWYGFAGFNALLTKMASPARIWLPRLGWVGAMFVLIRVAWRKEVTDARVFFFGFATALYFVVMLGWWLLISPRDFLPMLPLLAIFATRKVERATRHTLAAFVAAAIFMIVLTAEDADWFKNKTGEYRTMLSQALRLTRPGERVIDLKGETVFRPRPYYYVFESITRRAMYRGLIPDTIPEDVVRSRCYVAQADGEFWPHRARAFLLANFLNMGRLRAAGQWLDDGGFSIAIPGNYVMVGRDGIIKGTLDGTRLEESRHLAAGQHVFVPDAADSKIAVLWAPAFERGFTPFELRDRDY
jgi:hypothetical protein